MPVLPIEDDRMIDTAVWPALKDAACAMDWVLQRGTPIHTAESETARSPRSISGVPRPTARTCFGRLCPLGRRLPAIVVTARDRIGRIDFGQTPSRNGVNSSSRAARGERQFV